MYEGGYTGTVLRVDLSEGRATTEDLRRETARDFIGGAGFGIKYLYDELIPGIDPLSPQNKLIFASGPLSGSQAVCASRMAVTAKSPLTGAVGMSLSGGYLPVELKFAGYDVLIVQGKAEKPVYLWIRDDKIDIREANKLWGTSTLDCQALIKDRLGDQNVRIACIGPAGERLGKISCIVNERRAAGRKGLGAVMGSKNLKAIAVSGSGKVRVANPESFKAARAEMARHMRESPVLYPAFSKLGTPMVVDTTCALGIFPAKNWSATGQFEPVEEIGVKGQNARTITSERCYNCPVGCSQVKLTRDRRWAGIIGEPEFETFYSLGGQTGVDNIDAIIAGDRLCDEMGLDSMSAGIVVGFAMELYEKGILTASDTGGMDLSFGNAESMVQLIRMMAHRQGIGDVLADGVKVAAERIGKGSEKYAMHVKGLELPGYDVRGAKAHGLNYATAYTGADHNRGYAFQEIFGIPVPEAVDRFAIEGKGRLTKWNQDVRTATCDCPTMCAFLLDMALPGNATQNTSAMLAGLTGMDLSSEQVQQVGERVNNLARAFNVREGFTRKDDTLPQRLMTEPLLEGASKGQVTSRQDMDAMLNEYYQARGWNQETGAPTRGKLEELGLGYVADELAKLGKLG